MMYSTLFPPQQEVLNHGILDLGFSSVLSLSTGSGKTTLAEMGMDRALNNGERVVYLTPLKALAEEKITAWHNRWPGRKVGIFTGDYEASKVPVPYREADVLICTYERLDAVLRYWQRHLDWLSRLGLVVVDEFHLLMDPSRGPRLEGAISRLRRVNPFCRVMGLSATVSNHADLAAWLDGVSYHSDWRAVPLQHEVRRYKRLTDKIDLIVDIIAETVSDGGQTLVFASSRHRAEQIATQVSDAGYLASHHHAGLSQSVRREVETDFREGRLTCLVATPTLEMGLNLPCRTVVIADNTRWNGETFEPLPVWNYLQRAGRAGRPGQDGVGRAVLLAPTWARNLQDYEQAKPEPIRSRLIKSASLAEQILIEVASRSCRTRQQLLGSFLPSTLAYKQDPSITESFSKCLNDLVVSGLIREDQTAILHPTPAGWVAVRHQLSPATAKHLLVLPELETTCVLTPFDLLLHHCWAVDLQPQMPASIEIIDALEDLIRVIPSHLLDSPPPVSLSPRACASGVLMATLAWYFVDGHDFAKTCDELDVYISDAELLRQNLVRLLKASADLHQAIDLINDPKERQLRDSFYGPSLSSRIGRLSLRLEHGLTEEAVYLTLLQGCGGRYARRLLEAGITDLEDLCNMELSQLTAIPGIGAKRAQSWIESAEVIIKNFEPDTSPVPTCRSRSTPIPAGWPKDIDPGRLQRATLLTVAGGPDSYWVSGGAEEHSVQGDFCDCADFMLTPV